MRGFYRTLSAVAVMSVLAVPVFHSQKNVFEFEVATVKPSSKPEGAVVSGCRGTDTPPDSRPARKPIPLGRCVFERAALDYLIMQAYFNELGAAGSRVPQELVTGGPGWIHSDRFDIEAKAPDPSSATRRELRRMLRTLLADRFKLKSRLESKEIPGYTLIVAKNGPKLLAARNTDIRPSMQGVNPSPGIQVVTGQNASMDQLTRTLSTFGIGPVADKTDLKGPYDFTLTFELETGMTTPKGGKGGRQPATPPGTGPSLFTALEQQLGLRLVSQKILVERIAIDEVSKPTEN